MSAKKDIPADAVETLLVATIALKYTLSNSICIAYDGQVIGMGVGVQHPAYATNRYGTSGMKRRLGVADVLI